MVNSVQQDFKQHIIFSTLPQMGLVTLPSPSVLALTVLYVVILLWFFYRASKEPAGKAQFGISSKDIAEKRLGYINGERISLKDIWAGQIPYDSVFSPYNPEWYFNVSGLDANDQVIFSTSWLIIPELKETIQPFAKIKRFQVNVATKLGSNIDSDPYQGLTWE